MKLTTKSFVKGLLLISPTLLALMLLAGYWISSSEQASEAEREAPAPRSVKVELKNGVTTLAVDQTAQARSGIQVQVLSDATWSSGPIVYGTVMDLQPLADLSSRYATSRADRDAAATEYAKNQAELKRVQTLFDDRQNVSLKALEEARAAVSVAKAKVTAGQASMDATSSALHQQFGPTLANSAIESSPELGRFLNRSEVIVRVVLAADAVAAPTRLNLSIDGQNRIEAHVVSAAPQTDPAVQGRAYFYRMAGPLSSGTRLIGRAGGEQRSGLRIPSSAVVWYGGQPWAYARTSATVFERRAVSSSMPSNGDFLVTTGFAAGDTVVVQGAQLLLSEESRALLDKS